MSAQLEISEPFLAKVIAIINKYLQSALPFTKTHPISEYSQTGPEFFNYEYTQPANSKRPLFAIIIAINEYDNGYIPNLTRPVSAAQEMESFLGERNNCRVRRLYDAQATRQAIIDTLNALQKNTLIQHGERILIYFSGYSQKVPRPENASATGCVNQIILPHDAYASEGFVPNAISDSCLNEILRDLAYEKGNDLTVIIDSSIVYERSRNSRESVQFSGWGSLIMQWVRMAHRNISYRNVSSPLSTSLNAPYLRFEDRHLERCLFYHKEFETSMDLFDRNKIDPELSAHNIDPSLKLYRKKGHTSISRRVLTVNGKILSFKAKFPPPESVKFKVHFPDSIENSLAGAIEKAAMHCIKITPESQADLLVDTVGGGSSREMIFRIRVRHPPHEEQLERRAPLSDLTEIVDILFCAAHWHWHLSRLISHFPSPVPIDFCRLEWGSDHMLRQVDQDRIMVKDGVFEVTVGKTPQSYCMRIMNGTPYDLYPYLYYFSVKSLEITKCDTHGIEPVVLSIPRGSEFTIGHGPIDSLPFEFRSQHSQAIEYGFFKLFLTTERIDFSLTTTSPFMTEYTEAPLHDFDMHAYCCASVVKTVEHYTH